MKENDTGAVGAGGLEADGTAATTGAFAPVSAVEGNRTEGAGRTGVETAGGGVGFGMAAEDDSCNDDESCGGVSAACKAAPATAEGKRTGGLFLGTPAAVFPGMKRYGCCGGCSGGGGCVRKSIGTVHKQEITSRWVVKMASQRSQRLMKMAPSPANRNYVGKAQNSASSPSLSAASRA